MYGIISPMKQLLISDTDLKLLLERHRDDIGRNVKQGIADIFAGVTFSLTAILGDYPHIWISSQTWKAILFILGASFAVYGGITTVKAIKSKYTHNQLYSDIEQLNEISHPFSIVAIKDTFNDHPNRFLLHYDRDWKCRLFFSFRTQEDEADNIDSIRERLSSKLKVPADHITIEYKAQRIYPKYSVRDRIEKVYDHRIYAATIDGFPSDETSRSFQVDGVDYYWLTIDEMMQDSDIQQHNMDVVSLVRDYIV